MAEPVVVVMGAPLTPSDLLSVCTRFGELACVHAHPHRCRHTFAITYLRNGASAFAVQKMLGHSGLDVTLRYTAMLSDDPAAEHANHSPVASVLGGRRAAGGCGSRRRTDARPVGYPGG